MTLTTNIAFTLPRAGDVEPTDWPAFIAHASPEPETPPARAVIRSILAQQARPMSVRELREHSGLPDHSVSYALKVLRPALARTGECRWTYRYALRSDER
jgi:hypothetical protein